MHIFKRPRFYITGAFLAALSLLALVPVETSIRVPGLLTAPSAVALHAPDPAKFIRAHAVAGMKVKQGELLFELSSPQLDFELAQTEVQLW